MEPGITVGTEVTHYYDSLISKVVVWGETRGEAILRMRRALEEFRIVGVRTNIPFLEQILDRPSFIGGQCELDENEPCLSPAERRGDLLEISAVVAVSLAHQARTRRPAAEPRKRPSAWRVSGRWGEMSD